MSLDDRARSRILAERARRLAQRWDEGTPGQTRALFGFSVGSERFALDASQVQGVFRLRHLTPLPGAPAVVAGVTAWRGHILTVADLERALDITRTGLDDRVWVIVVGADDVTFGLLAGEVDQVTAVPEASIAPPERDAAAPVAGIAPGAVVILDGPRLARILTSMEVS